MSNPQIELVKKWLDDPKSVSVEELKLSAAAADADAASVAYDAYAAAADAIDVKYWVEKYEERTK